MLYAVLRPRCARPIRSLLHVPCAKLIVLRFALVASFFGPFSTSVLCGGDAVIKEQVVTFAQSL